MNHSQNSVVRVLGGIVKAFIAVLLMVLMAVWILVMGSKGLLAAQLMANGETTEGTVVNGGRRSEYHYKVNGKTYRGKVMRKREGEIISVSYPKSNPSVSLATRGLLADIITPIVISIAALIGIPLYVFRQVIPSFLPVRGSHH